MIARLAGTAVLLVCLVARVGAAQDSAQAPPPAASQPAPPTARVRVFLDCNECDGDYLRQNVGFVDYVRDRTDADFHVLVRTEQTGGGGLSWNVQFIGIGRMQAQSLTLTFTTSATDTNDDRRKAFARIFRLGLAGPAAATDAGPELDVTWTRPAAATGAATIDPWNYWVFNVNFNSFMNGERSSRSDSSFLQVSANRTTDQLKVNLSTFGNLSRNRFTIDDQSPITSKTHSYGVDGLIVTSLSPRWSLGATGGVTHSSFSNIDRAIGLAPAIEFNFFPYSESSKRTLTVQYAAGLRHYKFVELTVFDKLEEFVPRQAITANLGLHQPWGSMSVTSVYSDQLNEFDRYRLSIGGEADVRLFKGFSFNVFTRYERIRDQIELRKTAASQENILLRVQQLPTGYSYVASIGITYRFGSIFNNVVNTRFNAGGF